MTESSDVVRQIEGVSTLADPVRRTCYAFVCAHQEAVSRDQAAQGLNLARHTVKFHLDRLVEAGLLTTEYHRPEGRGGPGAGRPAKFYRRANHETTVSLPRRRYDLASEVMAQAIDRSRRSGQDVVASLDEAAREVGSGWVGGDSAGRPDRQDAAAMTMTPDAGTSSEGSQTEGPRVLERVCEVLAEHGYEPRVEDGRVVLGNCPFHALVAGHSDLVCSMNLALLDAVTSGVDQAQPTVRARLDPGEGRCCVVVELTNATEVAGQPGVAPDVVSG